MNLDILKFKLQQTLQNNVSERRKLSSTGRIEPSRLAHYRTSNNLYSQPIPNTGKKYKCDILLDVSGSMYHHGNDRIGKAVESTKNLVKLFHGIIDFRIIAFGNGFYQMSTNKLLSITPEKYSSLEGFKRTFNKSMGVYNTQSGEKNMVPMEGGTDDLIYGTYSSIAVKHSIDCLSSEDGEKIIIFITDGCDDKYYEEGRICGINYKENREYSKHISEMDKMGINFLPIGIDISLDKFANEVRINDASEIYEKTINFIETNFNK